jgi:hypothetical protein
MSDERAARHLAGQPHILGRAHAFPVSHIFRSKIIDHYIITYTEDRCNDRGTHPTDGHGRWRCHKTSPRLVQRAREVIAQGPLRDQQEHPSVDACSRTVNHLSEEHHGLGSDRRMWWRKRSPWAVRLRRR